MSHRECKGGYIEGEIKFGNLKKDDIDSIELDLVENKDGDVHPNVLYVAETERKGKSKGDKIKQVGLSFVPTENSDKPNSTQGGQLRPISQTFNKSPDCPIMEVFK